MSDHDWDACHFWLRSCQTLTDLLAVLCAQAAGSAEQGGGGGREAGDEGHRRSAHQEDCRSQAAQAQAPPGVRIHAL